MARIITDPQWTPQSQTYPWDEWLDGKSRVLVQGEDFTGQPRSTRMTAYKRAAARGLRLRTRLISDTELQLQAFADEPGGSR